MPDFLHGVSVVEVESGPRAIEGVSSSVIGIIGTAPAAVAEAFPLNTPVLTTGNAADMTKLGATGTLPTAIAGILAQTGVNIVVVRIAEGVAHDEVTADEATLENVIGGAEDGIYVGVHSFLVSKSRLGIAPRILIAPGFCAEEVIAEMIPIAERLRAVIVADTPTETDAAAVAFATACANPRVYAIFPQVINTKKETVAASPYAAGVIAKTDLQVGFWASPSNKIVNGIVGLSKPVDFSLGDGACKANYLNENGIATIVNLDGYRLWGNRTTSDEAAYKFLCVRRTADIISDSILRAHLWAVDRNIVKNYLTDVTESVNAYLATLKSQGAILAGKCFADKELNTAANIAEGKVFFDFSFTPAYPAEQVTFRAYLDNSDIESVIFENVA
ncbi:MAG: phage tail sheath subtilisin-like domain-containing protein [Holosporaceae bacterium]|jgi:phage tail sheath protein FI|nr:phage tail sheath subtilisin-like domain-containing protein [Holosporaceae bacterium]